MSLAFTTYQTNRLFLIGLKPDGRLSGFERHFDRPMGLYAAGERLYMSSRYQLWELDNALPAGETYNGYDRLYVPRRAYTTGEIDMHDIALDGDGRVVFVNTAYSCLATPSARYSFRPLWKPPFISRLAPEDRCHLNGLAMAGGAPAYVTSVSRSDVAAGWRDRRHAGGCVIDVEDDEIVLDTLSMPHSPRVYRDRLWLLNSGTGELGWVDRARGRFEPAAFCPGFGRGLAFHGDYAVVGLSKQRKERTFSGLQLDEMLKTKDADARCGLWVVDLRTGNVAHWLQLEGVVIELYDVVVLPGVRRPMALGFKTDDIRRFITIENGDGAVFSALPAAKDAAARAANRSTPAAAEDAYRRANALAGTGRFAEAVPLYEEALRLGPRHVNAWLNLGTARHQLGEVDAALACYREALAIDPRSMRAHTNLGRVLREQGQLEEAINQFRSARRLGDRSPELLHDLALVLCSSGRLVAARRCLEEALKANPRWAEGHNNLGGILRLERKDEAALGQFERAAALRPDFFEAHENMGMLLEDQGRTEEAKEAYARARAVRDDPVLALHHELLCPPVFASAADLEAYRQRAVLVIDQFAGRDLRLDWSRVQSARGGSVTFEWAYHSADNLALKRKYAALFQNAFSSIAPARRPPQNGPWRVAFVVTAQHEGVFARCMGGLVQRLDRGRFDTVVACPPTGRRVIEASMPDVRVFELPLRFDHAVAALHAAALDAIYFWEVGTDRTNYFLPFCRMAPVQCTGWGWPETSAAPHLDYHLTSAALASANADRLFGETLVRLPELPAYCQLPPVRGSRRPLSDLGLPGNAHLYLCAQTLRKAHPGMDALIARILAADPRAVVAFVHDKSPHFGARLRRRWDHTLDEAAMRAVLLPRQNPEAYMDLLASAHVVLDTVGFSGSNTAYDCAAAGAAVVTLPGEQPRARYTEAVCRQLGIEECIAATPAQYVETAVRLATDDALHADVQARIRAGAPSLFTDERAVRQIEDFFAEAIGRAARV